MKKTNNIISKIILACFILNTASSDYAFALSPTVTSSEIGETARSDTRGAMYALGQKRVREKIGSKAINFDLNPQSFIKSDAEKKLLAAREYFRQFAKGNAAFGLKGDEATIDTLIAIWTNKIGDAEAAAKLVKLGVNQEMTSTLIATVKGVVLGMSSRPAAGRFAGTMRVLLGANENKAPEPATEVINVGESGVSLCDYGQFGKINFPIFWFGKKYYVWKKSHEDKDRDDVRLYDDLISALRLKGLFPPADRINVKVAGITCRINLYDQTIAKEYRGKFGFPESGGQLEFDLGSREASEQFRDYLNEWIAIQTAAQNEKLSAAREYFRQVAGGNAAFGLKPDEATIDTLIAVWTNKIGDTEAATKLVGLGVNPEMTGTLIATIKGVVLGMSSSQETTVNAQQTVESSTEPFVINWDIDVGVGEGPGAVPELRTEEKLMIWKSAELLRQEKIRILLPQRIAGPQSTLKQFVLTGAVKKTIKDMQEKAKNAGGLLTVDSYTDKNLAELLKADPDVKNIVITEDGMAGVVESLLKASSECFVNTRMFNMSLPDDYGNIDENAKSICQMRAITISVLMRLYNEGNINVETVLKEMLKDRLPDGVDVNEFIRNIPEKESEAKSPDVNRLMKFLTWRVSLVELLGRELRILREFVWSAA